MLEGPAGGGKGPWSSSVHWGTLAPWAPGLTYQELSLSGSRVLRFWGCGQASAFVDPCPSASHACAGVCLPHFSKNWGGKQFAGLTDRQPRRGGCGLKLGLHACYSAPGQRGGCPSGAVAASAAPSSPLTGEGKALRDTLANFLEIMFKGGSSSTM